MPAPLSFSIVIPVYNEGATVIETIESIEKVIAAHRLDGEIVVVDDGSTDDTAQHLAKTRARWVSHPKNRGYGAALKTGILEARRDWIVILDADLTYPVEQLPKLLERAPLFDMVVGARQGRFYQGSLLKRFLRWNFKFLVEFATGQAIPDINSGFRVFRKQDVVPFYGVISNGFSFTTTITLLYNLNGRWVDYIPVDYHKRAGRSHVKLLRDGLRALQFIITSMAAYNAIKANLLLIINYLCGVVCLVAISLFCSKFLLMPALLVWSTVCLIAAGALISTTIQARSDLPKSRTF